MKVSLSALADFLLSLPKTRRTRFLVDLLLELSQAERLAVLKRVAGGLSKGEKRKLLPLLTAPSRVRKLDRWLESLLTGNPDITPRQAAFMATNYFGYSTRMLPFLIVHARRVKARLRMRGKQPVEQLPDIATVNTGKKRKGGTHDGRS